MLKEFPTDEQVFAAIGESNDLFERMVSALGEGFIIEAQSGVIIPAAAAESFVQNETAALSAIQTIDSGIEGIEGVKLQ